MENITLQEFEQKIGDCKTLNEVDGLAINMRGWDRKFYFEKKERDVLNKKLLARAEELFPEATKDFETCMQTWASFRAYWAEMSSIKERVVYTAVQKICTFIQAHVLYKKYHGQHRRIILLRAMELANTVDEHWDIAVTTKKPFPDLWEIEVKKCVQMLA
jgi:hypothetical protein